jgi:mannan endo-1,4-beta-mannosidase
MFSSDHFFQRFHYMLLALVLITLSSVGQISSQAAASFVGRDGTHFVLNGKPFYFAGTNNYYPIYVSNKMVDDLMKSAQSQGVKVIRIWAMIDVGSLDGSVASIDGQKNDIYFQYWDTAAGKPAYNDSANGLQKLDYVLKSASDFNLKVIPVLINNWEQFGGIDQYVKWYGLTTHDAFYTESKTQQAYKDWVNHVITRKNSLTGITYKDDPTIFAWELGNEPRCKGSGKLPTSATCNTTIITNWVSMMSSYIKNLDPNHMVSVGDEGFFYHSGSATWPYRGGEGVDTEAFLKLDTIDFGTYHMYPQDWGVNVETWPVQWIMDHIAAGKTIGKPVVFEEFGFKPSAKRDLYYETWTYTVCANGGAGWM